MQNLTAGESLRILMKREGVKQVELAEKLDLDKRTVSHTIKLFDDNRGTIKQGGHTNSKLYNYSNKNRTHPIKGAYAREVDSWNNNTSPIKALVNSGIGYALAPAAQAVYDYTKGALDI